ncbi:uncharacterized protein ATNIH1004_010971 [Aspergillus tanneri]|uniref:Major facilitator superfamily (MFS) profile domain-containing protein n=1 Tax=Aspergillus tanneri TaxID=1220188 RepID=A0A5M9M5N8_9EURO|nr:uncharacterized protein ATNIH1004_010971 [Aspergillus tanneri]KAA8642031.1 hypothetical protein ATNIH1004_010971 [Aspergillus tanneri]
MEVTTLGVTLYVLGFATGPTFWAPASELYGRGWPMFLGSFGYSIFTIGKTTAKDLQTIMLRRFFEGCLRQYCPLAPLHRCSRAIITNYMGWCWTMYIASIMGFLGPVLLLLFFFNETYPPVLLIEKAATLRRQTCNWGVHAKQDEIELGLKKLGTVKIGRPLRMLFTDPMQFW